jgi:AraC-like DNA-binding protein
VRRLFLSRLRRFFPTPPILVLRKEAKNLESDEEILRGEFLLTDHRGDSDLSIVHTAREVLPMPPCEHSESDKNFELVRDVTRVLADNFPDAELDLEQVADELAVPSSRLSRILNREVHISFRQMLRQVRIEEAKRLLLTSKLSIKEISARVGFSDSHYFSRIFKEMTGSTPSEYSVASQELIYN